jgi:hypothetical protein
MVPLLHDALRCVAFCPCAPAVVSLAIDPRHPCFLGRLLLHVDCDVQAIASQALQQLVKANPALLRPIAAALTVQLRHDAGFNNQPFKKYSRKKPNFIVIFFQPSRTRTQELCSV